MTVAVVTVEQRIGDVVVEAEHGEAAIISAPLAATVVVERMGIAGTPGTSGGVLTRVAAEAIGGQRAVRVGSDNLARIARPDDLTTDLVIGMTLGAVATGDDATIRSEGEIVEDAWSWSVGPIWLGPDGVPTQALPPNGTLFRLGVAAGPKAMRVSPLLIAKR